MPGRATFSRRTPARSTARSSSGNLAGERQRKPFVVPFSDGSGSAPVQLQRTVADAIRAETGTDPGAPSGVGQLAHLAFPLTVGEQGPLDAAGVPAVLVQVSGERGSSAERVSSTRLEGFGRAILSAVDALDSGPDVAPAMQTGLLVQRKTMPAWALRLLVGALLLPPAIVVADGLARARRRRLPIARWSLWTLLCSLPFLIGGLFAVLLGALGIIGAAPATPVPPNALALTGPPSGRSLPCCSCSRSHGWSGRSSCAGCASASDRTPTLQASRCSPCCCRPPPSFGIVNPVAALLLLPAVHLWLMIVSPELRPRPSAALALVALALLPLALLVWFYAHQLGLGPGRVAWMAVLLLAGGHVGVPSVLLWSLAFGCTAAAAMLALSAGPSSLGPSDDDQYEVTIRGPLSYAGPGSLGGTESALRTIGDGSTSATHV